VPFPARRRRLHLALYLPAASLLAAVLAGCSGSSRTDSPAPVNSVPGLISSTAPVPVPFLDRANTLCNSSVTQLSKRGPIPKGPSDPSKLTAAQVRGAAPYLAKGSTILAQSVASLTSLGAPPTGGEQWQIYLQTLSQYVVGTQAEATRARAGDPQGFLGAARHLVDLRGRVAQAGRAVGLGPGTACGRLF
jgi:hypothetical protein